MELYKIVMIGPFPPTVGGITSYMNSVIDSSLKKKYKFIPFSISRPTIGIVKEEVGYSVIKSIDLITLIKSILITFYHIIIYPIVLLLNNPRLIHIHTTDYYQFWENYLHIIISKLFRKKIILHIHATRFPIFYEESGKFARRLIENSFSLIDILVLLSDNQKLFFEKIIEKNKIKVLPNFVDLNFYRDYNHISNDGKDVIKIVFIGGEEAKRKGIYDIIKSIPYVISKIENIIFIFIGRCSTKKIMELINIGNLNTYVDFKGFLSEEEKREVLSESDIFILPSYAEGLPIAMLEAMASGLAVISTKVGAIPDTIKEGVNGFLISPGDYKALSQKITFLSKNQDLLEKIGLNNIELVEEKYDINIVIQKIDSIYTELIDSS